MPICHWRASRDGDSNFQLGLQVQATAKALVDNLQSFIGVCEDALPPAARGGNEATDDLLVARYVVIRGEECIPVGVDALRPVSKRRSFETLYLEGRRLVRAEAGDGSYFFLDQGGEVKPKRYDIDGGALDVMPRE